MTPAGPLERVRLAELELVRAWIAERARVLEVGGGSGWQAGVLASWGFDVASIDVVPSLAPAGHFPVQRYDGAAIPFADRSFDVVFSSNVLEHVPHVVALLGEMRRVLAPGGRAIHLLPTPAWRLWTSAGRIASFALRAARVREPRAQTASGILSSPEGRTLPRRLERLALGEPHGAYPGALSEIHYYSARRWMHVFRAAGFRVVARRKNALFCTGHFLIPALSVAGRRRLAAALGSSCHLFLLEPG